MRPTCWARWATCALAISICVPAFADRATRSLSHCTSFDQVDKSEIIVELTVRSTCTMPIDCSVSWRVVCAPESRKRRAVHVGAAKFALLTGGSQSTEASAAICGDDAWQIDQVRWRCEPNKD